MTGDHPTLRALWCEFVCAACVIGTITAGAFLLMAMCE
jgi:hypothetical protein